MPRTARRSMALSLVAAIGILTLSPGRLRAHCDTMDGPVVAAARRALDTGNINLALIWVQPGDETAIRDEFEMARAGRRAGGQAREDADMRFFEALVRIHRAGEGAPFTGIRSSGTDVGPAVAAADQALASGNVEPVRTVLVNAVQDGIERHFNAVSRVKSYSPDDVAAGRAYVAAYVQYTHFAEGLYDRATAVADHHEHTGEGHAAGHDGTGHQPTHAGHSSHTSHLPWILVGVLGLALVGETGWIITHKRRA